MTRLLTFALVTFAATPTLAGELALPLSYAMFEASVPHVDLAECPTALAAEGRFCRATLQHDAVNVFVFSEDGDQPLIAFQSWPADTLPTLLN